MIIKKKSAVQILKLNLKTWLNLFNRPLATVPCGLFVPSEIPYTERLSIWIKLVLNNFLKLRIDNQSFLMIIFYVKNKVIFLYIKS